MKKGMKKVISTLIVTVIILTAVPLDGFVGLKLNFGWLDFMSKASAEEGEFATTGKCGIDVSYSLDSAAGLLTISGTGAMYDYDWGASPFLATI